MTDAQKAFIVVTLSTDGLAEPHHDKHLQMLIPELWSHTCHQQRLLWWPVPAHSLGSSEHCDHVQHLAGCQLCSQC